MDLSEVRSVADFWSLMDRKFYNALSREAVAVTVEDIKNLNREDNGFLQEMKRKLNSHKQHMDMNNMGHQITSDEMVKKHWVPLLTEKAKEAWDKVENYNVIRSPPLWPTFLELLETQGKRAKTRERNKGKSTNHESVPNSGIWKYCQQCRSRVAKTH